MCVGQKKYVLVKIICVLVKIMFVLVKILCVCWSRLYVCWSKQQISAGRCSWKIDLAMMTRLMTKEVTTLVLCGLLWLQTCIIVW